ncbi:hypothetical protein ACQPXS_32740 [Streptomyces sp. CA-142005]|uniref:hypothetical protein n=1 Tax=Streptomyces sp. CA-142005 TaxID=3240052 RepID=UPI003D8DD91C
MSELEFYAKAALRGEVLGVELGAGPEAWEERVGSDFLDDVKKSLMRRDYGLVEVTFAKTEGSWVSVAVSLQIHRLSYGLNEMVPPPIEFAHGAFSTHVRIHEFRRELEMQGGTLCEIADASRPNFVHYQEPNIGSSVYVVDQLAHTSLKAGDIWSIAFSVGTEVAANKIK